jgi:hypothetical protein
MGLDLDVGAYPETGKEIFPVEDLLSVAFTPK